MTETTTRRGAMRKVAAGGAAAGVAWVAPRVHGLSLRPDHAAAQSGPGDSGDTPGAVLDLTLPSSMGPDFVSVSDSATLPAGLVFAAVSRRNTPSPGFYTAGPNPQEFSQAISGPAAGLNCTISFDMFGNAVFSTVDAASSVVPGVISSHIQANVILASGNLGQVGHIFCT